MCHTECGHFQTEGYFHEATYPHLWFPRSKFLPIRSAFVSNLFFHACWDGSQLYQSSKSSWENWTNLSNLCSGCLGGTLRSSSWAWAATARKAAIFISDKNLIDFDENSLQSPRLYIVRWSCDTRSRADNWQLYAAPTSIGFNLFKFDFVNPWLRHLNNCMHSIYDQKWQSRDKHWIIKAVITVYKLEYFCFAFHCFSLFRLFLVKILKRYAFLITAR